MNNNTDQQSSSRPSPCSDCHHRCAPPPCPAYRCYAPHSDTNHTLAINELSEKVRKLGDEMSAIRDDVSKIRKQSAPNTCTLRPSTHLTPPPPSCDYQDAPLNISLADDGTNRVLNNTV